MAKLGLTLAEVASLVGDGEVVGDGEFRCRLVTRLALAGPSDLSYVRGAAHLEAALSSEAGALIAPRDLVDRLRGRAPLLAVTEPRLALGRLLEWIVVRQRAEVPGVHPSAQVADSARLGDDVVVGAGAVVREQAVIGDRTVIHGGAFVGRRCVVGEDCVLHPNAVLREDVVLGERVTVHAGAVLGSDGYSFVSDESGHTRVPQVGTVVVGEDVEVGALATVDRATLDATVIGAGTKIGDLVHVGHNCRIGEHVLLLPLTAISGSVEIGDGVVFAGRSGSADNVRIGAGAQVGACAVTFKDVEPGQVVWGNPARPKVEEMRIQVLLGKLAKMQREIRRLKQRLDEEDEA